MLAGAFTQIAATATMLSVMGQRSFVVAYAYIKTEPVHVALFGLIFLGDKVTPLSAAAILIATAGVIVISLKAGAGEASSTRSTIVGLFSGALFAPFRDRLSRRHPVAASARLCGGGDIHRDGRTGHPSGGVVAVSGAARPKGSARYRARLEAIAVCRLHGRLRLGILVPRLRHHKAANVRTLALVEVLFAQGVTRFVFKQPTTKRESIGIVLVVIGVALLVWAY